MRHAVFGFAARQCTVLTRGRLAKYGTPEIFNTDPARQFAGATFTEV
ncbi:hypothetical protein LRP30_31930 [Bradyrhizobium sp. C-145]|nr:hypothetical protein [Bradyrhizobium sp. C-145]UQR61469.1 hypothetical protein LRP30_31930 [Bradyrhizobium sp. C-145]